LCTSSLTIWARGLLRHAKVLGEAAGLSGQEHRVSHEEMVLVHSGSPRLVINGEESELSPGQVALAPAGALLRLDNDGPDAANL